MIGGTDIVRAVRADLPVHDIVFRTVRRHWPHFAYQNAEEDSIAFDQRRGPWLPQPPTREFFIYRDRRAASSWDKHGATPKNAATMLYVILGDQVQPETELVAVTLVCSELSGEIKIIVEELEAAFRDATDSLRSPLEAA